MKNNHRFGAEFLSAPDLFPARASGEPWGSEQLSFCVGLTTNRIVGLNAPQAEVLRHHLHAFLAAGHEDRTAARASTIIRIYRTSSADFRALTRRGWTYALDFDHGPETSRIAGYDFIARLDFRDGGSGSIWTCREGGETFYGVIENFLRILVAFQSCQRGGVLLHSAAVVNSEDEATVYYGPSGAGKSTVAALAAASGRSVTTDDLNPILAPATSGRPHVIGSPFVGDLPERRPASYPVASLCRLVQSSDNSLRPLGKAEALATLLACAPFVNHVASWQPALMASLETLLENVPAYELSFRKSGGFWDLVDASHSRQNTRVG